MLDTAADVYNSFLDGIKKSYTGTVTPRVFNRLINEWSMHEWLMLNVAKEEGVDDSRKQIDDLQMLKVITDGVMVYNGDVMFDIIPDSGYVFSKPDGITPILNVSVPAITHSLVFPKYLRLLDVMFKINYVNNECELTGVSDYLKAQVLRGGERSIIMSNEYLKPKDSNLYYEVSNNKFRLVTGTASTAYSMKLEYLRYPRRFQIDPNRKVKGSLTILTNAAATGTLDFSMTTALATYQLTAPVVALAVTINQSKYVIAKNLYDAIQADTALPASIKSYTTLVDDTVYIGQNGYDVTAFSSVITGACVTTATAFNTTASDVNIELPEQQRKEIVEHAVRIYLERVTDERYKSFLTEETIREQSKK